jgi:hypothetical protein
MQEPFETLLAQYRGHPVIKEYLEGDVPAFDWLEHVHDMLTSEERIMVRVAQALHTALSQATITDLLELSDINLERVIKALEYVRTHRSAH